MEISKGSKVKYELDKKTGFIMVCNQTLYLYTHVRDHMLCGTFLPFGLLLYRLIGSCTRQWFTPTTTASSLERSAKTTIQWMF